MVLFHVLFCFVLFCFVLFCFVLFVVVFFWGGEGLGGLLFFNKPLFVYRASQQSTREY